MLSDPKLPVRTLCARSEVIHETEQMIHFVNEVTGKREEMLEHQIRKVSLPEP